MAAEADPKVTKLERIALACRTSVDVLLGRELPPVPAGNGSELITNVFNLKPSDMARPPEQPGGDAPERGTVIWIPRLDIEAAAGPGLVPNQVASEEDDLFGVREGWLRQLGVSAPRNVHFIRAVGDSMEDTIRDGDTLLVDRGIDRVIDNGIYVVTVAGLVVVKRLQLLFDGSLTLSSDNPKFKPETIAKDRLPELRIEGRVRWYGRTI